MAMKRKKARRKTKRKAKKGKKKAFGGYHIKPDAHLAKIIGHKAVTPSEMTKKIWTYIKKNKLANR
jgi:chromatin remodeling complex protein RSC6